MFYCVPHLIHIKGHFDSALVKRTKQQLRALPAGEKEIIIRINSEGGLIHSFNVICVLFYFMKKYRQCNFIAQCEHMNSAGFCLFLYFDKRQVHRRSIGQIHLPVSHRQHIELESLNRDRQKVVDYIKKRTRMTEQEIYTFQNIPFNAGRMLKLGIATELVDYFH